MVSVICLFTFFLACTLLADSFRVRRRDGRENTCHDAVPGALNRQSSSWRWGGVSCKCPSGTFVLGDSEACGGDEPKMIRKFNPEKFEGAGCACRPSAWLGREKSLELWRTAQAVCFDVDSTVITDEGIEVLAAHNGQLEAVRKWTERAMGGEIPFENALEARLRIIKPSEQNVTDVLATHPLQLTEGFKEMLERLRSRGTEVYLVSGGFRQMINPIADLLNIPRDHIFANNLLFEADGSFKGFDPNEPTSRKGGKAVVVQQLVQKHHYHPIIMVGDGATDMEARAHADAFIGFGGIAEREKVKNGADFFIRDWTELREQ